MSDRSVVDSAYRVPSSLLGEEISHRKYGEDRHFYRLSGGPVGQLPEHVLEAGNAALRADVRQLTRGDPRLLSAISRKLRSQNSFSADPEQEIVVTNGAMQALSCSIQAHVRAGDHVLLISPSFFLDQVVLRAGGVPVHVLTTEQDCFRLDFDRLAAAVSDRVRMLVLINPSNPSGVTWSEDDLLLLTEFAIRHNLIILSDEAYEKFVFDGAVHRSIASLPDMAQRTITVHSFTKSYGLRAARVGCAMACPELLAPILAAFDWSGLACNTVSQAMAEAALSGPQGWLESAYETMSANRAVVRDTLAKSRFLRAVTPSGGTFFFINVAATGIPASTFASRLIAEVGVPTLAVRAFSGGGLYEDAYIRFPFGGEPVEVDEAIQATTRFAERAAGQRDRVVVN